jgi:hypothetical protein
MMSRRGSDCLMAAGGDQIVRIVAPVLILTTRIRPVFIVRWASSPWTTALVYSPEIVLTVAPVEVLTIRTLLLSIFVAYAMEGYG